MLIIDPLKANKIVRANSGKSYRGERFCTVDLLVLSSLNQLLSALKIIVTFFTKQATLMRR
jgi:hypothetical protein